MSDDAIHTPSAATNKQNVTNEQTETTIEQMEEQPNVTAPAQNTSYKSVQGTASYQSSYQVNEPVQANQPVYQANQRRRVPGRPTLKMSKEQLMAAIGEVTNTLGHVPSYADLVAMHHAVWGKHGYAFQVFPPAHKHVNIHERVLHLWGRADGANCLPDFAREGSI